MKSSMRIFLISFFMAVPLIICNCGGDNSNTNSNDDVHGMIVDANHKLVSMRVVKVPCEMCTGAIAGALKNTDGVVRFEVFKDFERTHNVIVVIDPAKTNVDAIKAVMVKLGKTVEAVVEN